MTTAVTGSKPTDRASTPKEAPKAATATARGIAASAPSRQLGGFSYGCRPGRGPHDALDALATGILRKRVNWVLDADLRDFFSSFDHSWLMRFLEHRIGDRRILRLIQKWLRAGVVEDGKWSETAAGVPQGASASPLLANVYLHYAFDQWAHQWRKRHANGDMVVVR